MPGDRVYVSSGAFPADGLAEVIRLADAWGVGNLEFSSGLAPCPDWPELLARGRSGRRVLLHNYFPAPPEPFVLNLGAVDAECRAASVAHCERALRLTVECGAPFFSVHAGFAARPRADELGRPWDPGRMVPREESWLRFLEAAAHLADVAASLGTRLLIENNVLAPFNRHPGRPSPVLCCDPGELRALFDAVPSPALGLLLDTGHLKVSARTLGFSEWDALDVLSDRIGGFHVSDNDGTADSNQPFGSDAWFLPALSRWPEAPVVLEAYRLDQAALDENLAVLADACG